MTEPLVTRRNAVRYGAIGLGGMLLSPLLVRPAFATAPEKVDPSMLIDRKYQWHPSFTETAPEPGDAAVPLSLQDDIYTRDNYHARNVWGQKYWSAAELGNVQGAAVRWAGGVYTDGTPVDLVMKVVGYRPNWRSSDGAGQEYNFFYAATAGELNPYHGQLKPGVDPGAPLFEFCGFSYLDLEFSFYRAGTADPLRLAGRASLTDVDWGERVRIDGADKVCISKGSDGIWINGDESFQAVSDEQPTLEESMASFYFDCERFAMRYWGNPWKVGLACLDDASLLTLAPAPPTKSFEVAH